MEGSAQLNMDSMDAQEVSSLVQQAVEQMDEDRRRAFSKAMSDPFSMSAPSFDSLPDPTRVRFSVRQNRKTTHLMADGRFLSAVESSDVELSPSEMTETLDANFDGQFRQMEKLTDFSGDFFSAFLIGNQEANMNEEFLSFMEENNLSMQEAADIYMELGKPIATREEKSMVIHAVNGQPMNAKDIAALQALTGYAVKSADEMAVDLLHKKANNKATNKQSQMVMS